MKIKNVKIHLIKNDDIVQATADIYIKDGFRVRNIKIIQNYDNSLSLEFEWPIIKHTTFEPWTPEAKRMIERIVISAYIRMVYTHSVEQESCIHSKIKSSLARK